MAPRPLNPLHLDVASFVAGEGVLEGTWPGAELARLAQSQTPPQDGGLSDVRWRVHGSSQAVAGAAPRLWLALQASATLWLTCQRCLLPFQHALSLDQRILFVHGEAQAEALDAELEEDVLALTKSMNLQLLVEDELLLALPLVPRHAQCPQPVLLSFAAEGEQGVSSAPADSPFAVLARLKTPLPD